MESAIGNSVLVIDDDDESIEKIKRNLLQCEDEIEIAQSGQEGLELAEDGTPDLVILNLSLPDMDGWTVFGRLKAMPDFWDVPIILTDRSRTPDYAHAQAV